MNENGVTVLNPVHASAVTSHNDLLDSVIDSLEVFTSLQIVRARDLYRCVMR